MLQLYIALYRRRTYVPGTFHWALVCSAKLSSSSPVHVHQIEENFEDRTWRPLHTTTNLLDDPLFLGCVRLPLTAPVRAEDISELVAKYGATAPPRSRQWSSAYWVMNILNDLNNEHGLLDLTVDEKFYQIIIARGMQLGSWVPEDVGSSVENEIAVLDFYQ